MEFGYENKVSFFFFSVFEFGRPGLAGLDSYSNVTVNNKMFMCGGFTKVLSIGSIDHHLILPG